MPFGKENRIQKDRETYSHDLPLSIQVHLHDGSLNTRVSGGRYRLEKNLGPLVGNLQRKHYEKKQLTMKINLEVPLITTTWDRKVPISPSRADPIRLEIARR